MIDNDLLELINSGNAWVFVGSGVSMESGLPSWSGLVDLAIEQMDSALQANILTDGLFKKAKKDKNFPECFQRIEHFAGRLAVVESVQNAIVEKQSEPGSMVRLLMDWPAAGYLTTNYDTLLESAVSSAALGGWTTIGNRDSEVRKISGDVRDVIWHLHGSVDLPESKSTLTITSDNYNDQYLEETTFKRQLSSFLTQRRLIVVGFGLRDPEILRLLQIAGRYTVPERPIYAFLGMEDAVDNEVILEDLRNKYNVEVKQYRVLEHSHEELRHLLQIYSSMVVRRSTNFGKVPQAAPSYDPGATGLLIYNTLALQHQDSMHPEALDVLLSARILSLLGHNDSVSLNEIIRDIERISTHISESNSNQRYDIFDQVSLIIEQLQNDGMLFSETIGNELVLRLTDLGYNFATERAGTASRMRDQFRASLLSRSTTYTEQDSSLARDIADVAGMFFEDCLEKRSLGVAKVLSAPDNTAREYQMVALLQELPMFFDYLPDPYSARILVRVIQQVLSAPTEAEAKYCGLLLQARLAVNLLGIDQYTFKSRTDALRDTVFVLDSTSLIPLLAVSGTGHRAATELVSRIEKIGASAITTRHFVVEACEHAIYAVKTINESGGMISPGMLDKLMGKSEERSNVFLSGFTEEYSTGSIASTDFSLYMRQVCGFRFYPPNHDDCIRLVHANGVEGIQLAYAEGFTEEDFAEMEELKTQIEGLRLRANSYRHDRQVLAEAEALLLIQKFRDHAYTIKGKSFGAAFFVSNSRFIDRINSSGLPVTMRESALIQWLGTIVPFEETELSALMDGLLWELSERGIDFVDRKKLRAVFSSTISAAKEDYSIIMEQHRILIADQWGVDPSQAFHEPIDDLDIVSVVPRHALQTIDRQQKELETTRLALSARQGVEGLNTSERTQLERLRAEKKQRVDKNKRKRRSQAKPKKGKGRRSR